MTSTVDLNTQTRVLQNEINNIDSEISQYKKSLDYAQKLKKELSESCKHLDKSNDYIKKYFIIGGKTGDNNKVLDASDNIQKIIKKLDKKIIPGINSHVDKLCVKKTLKQSELRRVREMLSNVQ